MHITFSRTVLIINDKMKIICLSPSLNRLKCTEIYTFSMDNVLIEFVLSHCQTVQILSLYLSSYIHLYFIQQPAAQGQAFCSLWCKPSGSIKFAFIWVATVCKEIHISLSVIALCSHCHYTSVNVTVEKYIYLVFNIYPQIFL